MNNHDRIRRSMRWAAYGDALGFITELASGEDVRRRIGASRVTTTVAWTKRIGGRFGADVELPVGCYSDDTQLRLATCRSLRGDGVFDVEVFAKVELPVWLAYALGAGKGTKAAATALTRKDTIWATNFFDNKFARYVNGGGNGAAMRIQPHVWSAPETRSNRDILRDVLRNAVTTHGHPRGILGAAFHALCLRYAMQASGPAGPVEWLAIADEVRQIPALVHEDKDLSILWEPTWEHIVGKSFGDACKSTEGELLEGLSIASNSSQGPGRQDYIALVGAFGALSPEARGDAIKTSILAAFLAWSFKDDPASGVLAAANLLGSDTDTIATMAGALLGAFAKEDIPGVIQDSEYIDCEAERLSLIHFGRPTTSFDYPDLLGWIPPAVGVDAITVDRGALRIEGLGPAKQMGYPYTSTSNQDQVWQWAELSFGQRILVRRRATLFATDMETNGHSRERRASPERAAEQPSLFDRTSPPSPPPSSLPRRMSPRTLYDATELAEKSGFDPRVVGELLIELAEHGENAIELSVAFAAIVARAKQARVRHRSSP